MLLAPFFRGLARHLHLSCVALTALTTAVFAQTSPTAADGFDPNVDGIVYDIATQQDGKILVVGQFGNVRPNGGLATPRNNIARFSIDGSLDGDFNPNANGPIRAVLVQPDGSILIGGEFTSVAGQPRNRIARLTASGQLDTTFTASILPDPQFPTTPAVYALQLQPDGSLLVGGTFGAASSQGVAETKRRNLAKFFSDGRLDLTYDPSPNAIVRAFAMHENNNVIVVGGFTEFQESGKTTPTTRNRAARLSPTGVVDPTFDPNLYDAAVTVAVQPDGKIIIGGYFRQVRPPNDTAPQDRLRIVRLNRNGTNDSEFNPLFGGDVNRVAVAADGTILVGGRFSQVYGRGSAFLAQANLARLRSDGTVDTSFTPYVNGEVIAIRQQSDGKILIGGYFTRVAPSSTTSPVNRNHIARLNPNGSIDTAFELVSQGRVMAVTQDDAGRIYLGGTFTHIGGSTRRFMARLNNDGTVDPSYNPNFDGPVYALAYDSTTNKVLAGGGFTRVGPSSDVSLRDRLARLNPDGTVDSEFNTKIDGPVSSILLKDGAIYVAGNFGSARPFAAPTSTERSNILKLTSTGQIDANYNPYTNGLISAMAMQADGKIIIVGNFTALMPGAKGDPIYRNYIARLNTDGTVDTGYSPNADAPVSAIVIQSDNKAVIGGRFGNFFPENAKEVIARRFLARVTPEGQIDTTFNPNPNGLVLTLALSGGNIVAGGAFTTFQPAGATDWSLSKYIGQIKADGSFDPTFNLDLNEEPGNRVDKVAVLPNGDLLVSGTFTSLQPTGSATRVMRNHLARVTAAGALVASFDPKPAYEPNSASAPVVNAIALQPDGAILVGGAFADLGGATSRNVARFSPEGLPDYGFNTTLSVDGPVNALAVRTTESSNTQLGGLAWIENNGTFRSSWIPRGQAPNSTTWQVLETLGRINTAVVLRDGSLIVAGIFSDQTNVTGGNVIKFKPNGEVDQTFRPNIRGILGILEQSDGKLIVHGTFLQVGDASRSYLARLNADGSLDTSYNPNPNHFVNTAVMLPDNSIIIGGRFTSLNPGGSSTPTSRNYIAKVSPTGTVESFNPNLSAWVYALALQPDGKVLVGGTFTHTTQGDAQVTRNRIARFNADGSLDTGFDPNANDAVSSIALLDGKIIIGGIFTIVGSANHATLARLNADGSVDHAFTAGTNASVSGISAAGDSILVWGAFTSVNGSGSTTRIARNHLARFTKDGQVDLSFNPNFAGAVTNVVRADNGSLIVTGTFSSTNPTGTIVLGGSFTNVAGIPMKNLAQLNSDGSVNAAFQPNPDAPVNALLPLPDGRFVVGGSFTAIAGTARRGIARFSKEGALDTSFNPPVSTAVATLASQPDGKVLVGTESLAGLIRLNTDGSQDTGFAAGVPLVPAVAIAVQPDGKIIAAGTGSGVPMRIVRLNSDGSVDTSFATVSVGSGDIRTLTLQADGSVIVAGSFTSIANVQISNVARLRPNGSVDTSFNPGPNGAVTALALQTDGRVLLGGSFTQVGTTPRAALARVTNTAAARQTLGVSADGRTITWLRSGTAGEIMSVLFEKSVDGESWQPLGEGTRIGTTGAWQLTGIDLDANLPADGNVTLRARGIVATSAGKSTGIYETVLVHNRRVQISSLATIVAPVVTSNVWDTSHYVWTVDAAGVLRIADIYSLVSFDSAKTVLINGGSLTTAASAARLADLATRGIVSPGSPLISGFAIVGSSPRQVLLRAAGPGLAKFDVANYLRTPKLQLYTQAGTLVSTHTGWDASLLGEFARVGAFPFTAGSSDVAVLVTLQPGIYTVHVSDATNTETGDTLVEVYDAGVLSDGGSRLMNLSTRGNVGSGATLIGGLVIAGEAPKAMLVRGVGPGLTRLGVQGVLQDPVITVYDSAGTPVATNEDWGSSTVSSVSEIDYAAAVSSAAQTVGAFSLASGSKDAALVITLPAGAYTVQLRGGNNDAGSAMIEVYELP